MDSDLFLVIGLVIAGLSLPSIIGALVDNRIPRAAAILVMIGGGMIALAVTNKPSGYNFKEIPQVFTNVVGRYLR